MKSISKIIADIENAEDLDQLSLQTSIINLMNETVQKLGGRKFWITDDTRAYNAICNVIWGIAPVRTSYEPQRAGEKSIDDADPGKKMRRGGTGDLINSLRTGRMSHGNRDDMPGTQIEDDLRQMLNDDPVPASRASEQLK